MKLLSCTALLLCASSTVMASHVVSKCSGIIFKLCPEGYKQEWRGYNPIWFDCFCVRPETALESEVIAKTDKCNEVSQKCLAIDNIKSTDQDNSCSLIYDSCEKEQIDSVCSTLKDRKTNWQCVEDYGDDFGNFDEGSDDEDFGDDDFYGSEDFDYEDGGDDWDENEDDFGDDEDDFGGDEDDFGGDEDDFGGDEDDFGGDEDDFGGDEDDFGGDEDDFGGDEEDYGDDEEYGDEDYDY